MPVSPTSADTRQRAARARRQSAAVRSQTRKLLAKAFGVRAKVSPRLSAREWSVLVWLNSGLTSKEIATQLGVTRNTVNYHVANIYRKLDVHSRVQAANVFRWALYPRPGKKP